MEASIASSQEGHLAGIHRQHRGVRLVPVDFIKVATVFPTLEMLTILIRSEWISFHTHMVSPWISSRWPRWPTFPRVEA